MLNLPLSPQVFLILRHVIEEHTGIHYADEDLELVAGKVSPRALERGFESLLDYYYFLRYDPDGKRELDSLAEHLVVNETYFFREVESLQVLVERFLRPRIEGGQPVRIWSAACATGEEPLTLAMLLANRGLLKRAEIVATDLSERVLERARRGQFGVRSLRAMPHAEARSHLDRSGAIDPKLISAISWSRLNLLDDAAVRGLGTFDAVLCRNVLIYFSNETAQKVVASLLSTLRRDGPLLVGVSESLLRMGSLVSCEEHGGYFFYRAARL